MIGIDLPGMGASSRQNDYDRKNITPEQSNDYFNYYIERWREGMKNLIGSELTKFCLVGHSFGGFIASNYALKYPEHIKKLVLLSPIGMYVPSKDDIRNPIGLLKKLRKENPNQKGPPIWALRIFSWFWNWKITIFTAMRFMGQYRTLDWIRNKFIRG